jgi:hypothetical protein
MSLEDTLQSALEMLPEQPSQQELAVVIEMMTRYIQYLKELEQSVTVTPEDVSVMVKQDGVKIRFKNMEDFSSWMQQSM